MNSANRGPLVVLLGLVIASVVISLVVVTPAIWLDDPFIGMRYASNLAAGNGLYFNPGDHVEGYTAFGWVMLGWVAIVAGFEPLPVWQVASVLAQVASLGVVYAMGRSSGRSAWAALFAPGLLAFHITFVTWPMMGMSTSFVALVVATAVLMVARGALDTTRGALALGALLLVLALTRFDGLGHAGLVLLFAWVVERRFKATLPAIAVLGVGLLAYNGWRLGYYNAPLPNTFYVKQTSLQEDLHGGLKYMKGFARDGGPYLLLALLVPLTVWRASRVTKAAAWVALGHVGYVISVGGDWMVDYRFVLPTLPLFCLLMQEGLFGIRDRFARPGHPAPKAVTLAMGAVLSLVFLCNLTPLVRSEWHRGTRHAGGAYWHAGEARTIAKHLDAALPADSLVATEWAGIIPFYMRQPIFDIFGLNDSQIMARGDEFPGSKMGRGITPEYLVERSPDLVIVVARLFPTVAKARAGIDGRPEGTRIKDFYRALRDPAHGYELCVVQVGPGAYWPCLTRNDFLGRQGLCVADGDD